ncbi:tRNA splicing endonuclease subunit 54 L homeolog [Xenopus laevis]|uniref:MGC80279 protein n=1 Tax=Xenopus laevis TaxID=8355 RepID=Q6DE24_XENLA|nr:tRNA splicing endonuclease subunit 54 L homeolog [Xenopus laevis]AAH77322.1 MGC80279 protein [Xenopus laevis]
MLSPKELLAARNREKSLPQLSHGQKDFIADGLEIQKEKLQVCLAEQWELLKEERVERLGSLVKSVWRPKEDLVELTSPAGKFWQTMGFTYQGKQCLLPEEAVYLLECGAVQIFYRDSPLSVQEAYERLLGNQKFPVLHYQVYSHLKRLGYIVTRFDPSSVQSPYHRQLNLESFIRPQRKRKRSTSPGLENRMKPDTARGMKKEENHNGAVPSDHSSADKSVVCSSELAVSEQDTGGLTSSQLMSGDHHDTQLPHKDSQANDGWNSEASNVSLSSAKPKLQKTFHWDFSKICLPNCGSDHPCIQLPAPEPSLLPENVAGREVDISCWVSKLNRRLEKLSRREREQIEWERKYKSSVNNDPKVQKCTNWKEYKELLLERGRSQKQKRPPHLWESTVTPLLKPGPSNTTASVLEQISVMEQSFLLDDYESWPQSYKKAVPQIIFNVHQADGASEFKKSKPGKPCTRMCVRSFADQVPSLWTVKMLAYQSGDIPLIFAIVDNGEVAFYSFKEFDLPVDVYP